MAMTYAAEEGLESTVRQYRDLEATDIDLAAMVCAASNAYETLVSRFGC